MTSKTGPELGELAARPASRSWLPARRALIRAAPGAAVLAFAAWLLWAGLVRAPGLHDNDWPLLMWLVKHASFQDPSSLAIGHYAAGHLLLAWWLYPLFGSTLAAAKVLSTLGAVGSVVCLYLMTRREHGEPSALIAAALFALSGAALLTGQSEYADAPACALFLAGLCYWWRGDERRGLLAGVLLGSAGLLRIHFVFFSLATAGGAALLGLLLRPEGRSRRESALAGLALIAGTLLGNLPGFLLNLSQHGQLGSAVTHTYVGQVVYGMDRLDLLRTYDAHPFGQILREQPFEIVRLMLKRARAQPLLWLTPLAAVGVAFVRRRAWPRVVLRHVLLIAALSFAYFWLFVSLSWGLTPRLLFSITALNCWLLAAVVTQLLWGNFRYGPAVCGVAFMLLLGLRLPADVRKLQTRWQDTDRSWQLSTELTRTLRGLGMKDAREAFVFEWNRFVVDDPELQPFYDFGFWNLLLPKYRAERPIPTPYLNDLAALSNFFVQQQVKFFVVPKKAPERFPELQRLADARAELPGFRREAALSRDVLFLRQN